MKKSLLLGAAALAAVALAPTADAGQVSFGGYYRFQVLSEDTNITDEASNQDHNQYMRHRLQLKMDMSVSPKTHAHVVMRPIDNDTVEGANSSLLESTLGTANAASTSGVSGRVDTAASNLGGNSDGLNIMAAWLETEMWGVGVKVGEMPVALNDRILINDDGDSSMGGILLSKTFSNKVTALLGKFALDENNVGGSSISNKAKYGASEDDVDAYALALLGAYNGVHWNLSVVYANGYDDATVGSTALSGISNGADANVDNLWVGLTLNGKFNNVDWVATVLYENGYNDIATNSGTAWMDQLEGSGAMAALRLNGKVSWGEWNGYGFYGSKNFDSINNRPNWSMLYDSHGTDLMHNVLLASDSVNAKAVHANDSGENAWGLGLGAKFKAGIWTINPQIDLVRLSRDDYSTGGIDQQAAISGAWGGTLKASTDIDTATTLSLVGAYVAVDENHNNLGSTRDDMHTLLAEIRMNF